MNLVDPKDKALSEKLLKVFEDEEVYLFFSKGWQNRSKSITRLLIELKKQFSNTQILKSLAKNDIFIGVLLYVDRALNDKVMSINIDAVDLFIQTLQSPFF